MRTFSQYLVAILAVLLIASCGTSKKVLKNGDKWIPAEFDAKNTILLVENWDGLGKSKGISEQKKMMTEKYPYKFEVVPSTTIKSRAGKYADTKLYRWALMSTVSYDKISVAGGTGTQTTVNRDFNFHYRENNKSYQSTRRSQGSYKRTFPVVINTIVQHVEK